MFDLKELVGGLLGPSANPLPVEPMFGAGDDLEPEYFVAPVTRFQNQEDRNSCNPHAHARPIESALLANGIVFQVCRADLYSGALAIDGNEGKDRGTTMAAVARHLETKGVLSEFDRPYKSDDVTRRSRPELDAFRSTGLKVTGVQLAVAPMKAAIKACCGLPHGHVVHENHRPDADGYIPRPDGALHGYHATTLEGWSDKRQAFLCAEHWAGFGIDHPLAKTDVRFAHLRGKRGYTWRPYAAWVVKGVSFEPQAISGVENLGIE